jgi:hypothetical protein
MSELSTCPHLWQHIYEEALIGGAFPIGWQCKRCNAFVDQTKVGVIGLPGADSGEVVLIGPHGCTSQTSAGKPYKRQTLYPDGRLVIE